MLSSSISKLTAYLQSDAYEPGSKLPGKTFGVTPGCENLQTGTGALTHEFELRGVRERRMVLPYQVWMLQRVAAVLEECRATAAGRASLKALFSPFPGGDDFLQLEEALEGCRLRKQNGQLVAETTPAP